MSITTDRYYMNLALSISKQGLGMTGKNPSVGCVIVKDNIVIGRGVTGLNGIPHAEECAIKNSICNTAGSTMYITLEPCAHYGKTPPCVETILKAGIKNVVIGIKDPDPRVNGKGIEILK